MAQAVTQRPSRYRLELFKTGNGRGWGVRSLDMIPQHGYVCTYLAQVYDAAEHEQLVRTVEEQDAEYTFDMGPRPDTNWDGSEKAVPDTSRAEFVACGLRKRNVGAFLNHSCAPNCFVQPVLDTHHDTRCPKICIFASGGLGSTAAACCYLAGWNLCSRMLQGRSLSAGLRGSTGLACLMRADNIAPMTELTLDYGEAYAAGFRGGCKCGAADCISQRIPRAATAPVADSPTACPLAAAAAAPASSSRAATSSDD
jgi:euchromatic histone-lysine N-methyltransferase